MRKMSNSTNQQISMTETSGFCSFLCIKNKYASKNVVSYTIFCNVRLKVRKMSLNAFILLKNCEIQFFAKTDFVSFFKEKNT